MTNPDRALLERLTNAAGAPGHESEVRGIVRDALEGIGDFTYDRLGSILCTREGKHHPRVMLDAHLDEVGFMVQSITEQGLLKFITLGGWWGHVLPAQRVEVVTETGKVPGIIGSTPPHFLTAEQRSQVQQPDAMYIDVGASSREQIAELGIRIGDTAVPYSRFGELAVPGMLSAKAFDNRCGCGVLCETMQALAASGHPNTVIGVGAVQEEVGTRGAGTAVAVAEPDVAIVLEGTPADDVPGMSESQAVIGKGPQIRICDPTALSNRRLVRLVEDIAAREGIEIQLAVRKSGGTDARPIHVHHHGIPTTVIGVPARFIHTHASIISWHDYCAAVALTTAVVQALDGDAVAKLVDYGDS